MAGITGQFSVDNAPFHGARRLITVFFPINATAHHTLYVQMLPSLLLLGQRIIYAIEVNRVVARQGHNDQCWFQNLATARTRLSGGPFGRLRDTDEA